MSLQDLRVGVTSHRKGPQLVAALERRGAVVRYGPTVGGDHPVPSEHILADTASVIEAEPDWLVASTGVGMTLWVEAAAAAGRLGALRETAAAARCVARGVKAVGGLRALQVEPVWCSPQQSDADVAGWLAGHVLPDEVVAVQLHGAAEPTRAYAAVEAAGAEVLSVATYRHTLPEVLAPAVQLIGAILDGELDVVLLTSAGAARNLVELAERQGPSVRSALLEVLTSRVATAVIGPVTASALEELGIPAWVTPARPRTTDLIRSLERWVVRRDEIGGSGVPPLQLVPLHRSVRIPGGDEVELGERGYAVLATLVRRHGAVCTGEELLAQAWGHASPGDAGAVKHHVARLRRKLAGSGVRIHTIRGVGYRLERGPAGSDQRGTSGAGP